MKICAVAANRASNSVSSLEVPSSPFVADHYNMRPLVYAAESTAWRRPLSARTRVYGEALVKDGLIQVGKLYHESAVNRDRQNELYVGEAYQDFAAALKRVIEKVFAYYVKRKIVKKTDVQDFMSIEQSLPLNRSEYLVSTDHRTHEPIEVVRLFNASPRSNLFPNGFTPGEPAIGSQLPTEIEYPHLIFPERELYGDQAYLFDIGRLIKLKNVLNDGLEHIFWQAANYFRAESVTNRMVQVAGGVDINDHNFTGRRFQFFRDDHNAMIYFEATAAGATLYSSERYGFQIAYGPEQTRREDRYILKMSVAEFIESLGGSGPGATIYRP